MINENLDRPNTQFPNLRSAGRSLVSRLEHVRDRDDILVLGIVSGGVPVALEVALGLEVPLDLLIIRRLLAPRGPGSQLCAVNVAGTLVLDDELPPVPIEPVSPLDHFLTEAMAELHQRSLVCRGERNPIELAGRTIILVDCGIRSGLTMQAAIEALRTRSPRRIVAAAPVASIEGGSKTREIADEFVCCDSPEPFGHVGVWYRNFNRPQDDRLSELIREMKADAQ